MKIDASHINRVTWILGLSMVGGLALVGRGAWDWQTALGVEPVFASSGCQHRRYGLPAGKAAL